MSTEKKANAPVTTRASDIDATTGSRVIESIVLRGDLSGLGPTERARFYTQMCESLGLNPHAQPFAFLRLNGKEVLYATRGATDQLAAMHRLNREIVDGPKVIDLAGTKLVYAVCRATLPDGRFETATATVPLVDPVNVLMKCETKAKRRATLSILGLGMLDEAEVEGLPASATEPATSDAQAPLQGPREEPLAHASARSDAAPVAPDEEPVAPRGEVPVDAAPSEIPAALEGFYARLAEIEKPLDAVGVWLKHRLDLATLNLLDRESAWKALCRRTEEVGKLKNAKVWLKKAIAEEDARAERRAAQATKTAEVPS